MPIAYILVQEDGELFVRDPADFLVTSINGLSGAHTIVGATGISVGAVGLETSIQNTGVITLNGKNSTLTISSDAGIQILDLTPSIIGIKNTGVLTVNSANGEITLNGEVGGIGVSTVSGVITFTNLGVKKLTVAGEDLAGNVTIEGTGGITLERVSSALLRIGLSLEDVGSVHIWDTTTDDEWTKPAGAKLVLVLAIAGGGGGASGECRDAGLIRKGGGGGAAGQRAFRLFSASILDETVNVVIGSGGTGGAGVTSGNGNSGSYGTETIFNDGETINLTAQGGNHGIGGGFPVGGDGILSFYEFVSVQPPAAGDPSDGTANAANPADSYYLSAPAGGGGSIGTDGTRYHGGKGGKVNFTVGSGTTLIAGGDYGVSEGENGNNGSTGTIGHAYQVSSGGGGGASGDNAGTIDGGNGGNGSDYGAGGGGGGAATTGATSGNGGNGAGGYCLVITICG